MGLQKYQQKRKFSKTPEPKGKPKRRNGPLRFVVQKHHASQLHYDFRLEMGGVLKSWAVPKGPSMDPGIKHLAMMVEDHPYDYRNFEGVIPEGNYGAGPVIVWDEGTYESYNVDGLKKGDLKFILHGKKLQGEFALVKIRSDAKGKAWLLIKKKDQYASKEDITKKDESVKSGKTLEDLESSNDIAIDGYKLQLTNLDKIFWPHEKCTKGDVIQYYRDISKIILPYLKDRPENMNRHPNGITGENFYQKDVDHQPPKWVKTVPIYSESNRKHIQYLVCNNEATLVYMANLGCIELNPWNSRLQKPNNPDFVIIDLDPEGIGFDAVVEAAQTIHEILEKANIPHYPKTSGASGLHICIPLGARYDYDQARDFAHIVAMLAHEKLPTTTSLERSPAKRKHKVYLDYLQNRRAQTLAVAYCLRPKPGAPVSTPLEWKEVKPGLDPTDFNIKTIFDRVKKQGDLWKPILGKGIDLLKAIETLAKK